MQNFLLDEIRSKTVLDSDVRGFGRLCADHADFDCGGLRTTHFDGDLPSAKSSLSNTHWPDEMS